MSAPPPAGPAPERVARVKEGVMGRAEEVEALANECAAVWTYIGGHLIEVGERRGGLASLDLERTEQALREYAALLREVAERCAPLVEALSEIAELPLHRQGGTSDLAAVMAARIAINAWREREDER